MESPRFLVAMLPAGALDSSSHHNIVGSPFNAVRLRTGASRRFKKVVITTTSQ